MQFLPCPAPTDSLEPAPLTDLSVHMGDASAEYSAFWVGDDAYVVCARTAGQPEQWFHIDAEMAPASPLSEAERLALSTEMANILPMSTGRVAFPVGSNGRTVYRIWRSPSADHQGRSRIRAVRAGRSRRLPA